MTEFDIIADWVLNTYCNFSCPYCYVSLKDRIHFSQNGIDAGRIVSSFDASAKKWLVHMSGREPFFYPDFYQLMQSLTERHYISMNTNLSSQLAYALCKNIPSTRVSFVNCSLYDY